MDAEKAGGEGRLRVRYDVRNFGPIREGSFELAPLTVFIGPNGSGKTYAATVAYLFTRALAESITVVMPDMLLPDAKDRFRKWVAEWPERAAGWMERRMAEYFGRESVNGLPRRGEDSFQIAMTWERGETSLHLRGHWHREQNWRWESEGFDRLRLSFPLPDLDAQRAFFGDLIAGKIATPLSYSLGLPEIYYLPAARAGLLQGWRGLAEMAIRIVRGESDIRRLAATPYFGVVGDFLLMLLREFFPSWRPRSDEKTGEARAWLEREILHGHIDQLSRDDPQLLLFQKDGIQVPLSAISSGIAELSPLDLLLSQGSLQPGHWLMIDEPEAHLHPENQRRVATLLVRLVRAGVRVLCTTHSDLILHQISNHLLLGEAIKKGARPQRMDPEWDWVDYDEVAVYLFRLEKDGSVIEPVPTEPGWGIHEDEFLRVAEEIGAQTYGLIDLIETDSGSTS